MKIYTYAQPLDADIVDVFCSLQNGFTDQFVYYDKQRANRYMGLGRCIAVPSMREVEYAFGGGEGHGAASLAEPLQGGPHRALVANDAPGAGQGQSQAQAEGACLPPVFFQFTRFDAANPKPADELFSVFPRLRFMLPEVVLVQNEQGTFLQVNSLGPVYPGRVERFVRQASCAPARLRDSIPFSLQPDDRNAWREAVEGAKDAIANGWVDKVVLARRLRLEASRDFSSSDLLVNLIDGTPQGTVYLYRYGDVFFCGCTPELLARKRGLAIEGMCLAGTTGRGKSEDEREQLAAALLADDKNLREHAFVVDFMRQVVQRNCHSVNIPNQPEIRTLAHVQHLHTPVSARMMEGRTLYELVEQLHPTPALAGMPVGEALMLIRQLEQFNRGFFGGPVGVLDAEGNGEYSVAIRGGVFDGRIGWVYAGCGIVEGSQADDEYDEIDLKLKTILSAFDGGAA